MIAAIVTHAVTFGAGVFAGVALLAWAQVREAKRRIALSKVLDRRRVP